MRKKYSKSDTFFLKKNYLLALYINLLLMKNFVNGMDRNGARFQFLRDMFSNINDAKIKESISIFVGILLKLRGTWI